MSLSKQQTIGAVGGGVFLVLAGALGWMLFSAWSERGEAEERLEGETSSFRRYNEAAVFPSKGSIASVKSNETSYAAWYESAVALAARGDRVTPVETPPIFKQRLQAEVRRMAALPGGANGHISAETFLFGFEQYLGEGGVLPQSADVPRLANQLDAITTVVDMCAEAGVLEIKSVQRAEPPKADEDDQDRGKKKKKGKKAAEADELKQTCLDYAFEVTTRPAAFVSLLNALTSTERFFVVKNLSFRESSDMIVDKITAIESAAAQKSRGAATSGGGRRRRGMAAAVEADAAQPGLSKDDRIVVDPELDAPIVVKFNLSVYDFGRAAAPAAAAEAPAEAKSEEKKEGK